MSPELRSALEKARAQKSWLLNDGEATALLSAARAAAPKITEAQIAKEAKGRATCTRDELATHDWISESYNGLRELDLDDDQASAASDVLIEKLLGQNAEQAEAVYAKVEAAIAATY